MKKCNTLIAMAGAAVLSFSANAEQLWSDTSFSYLKGGQFKALGEEKADAQFLTLEHVSGHTWGGMFFFVDRVHTDNGYNEVYGEVSPKFTVKSFESGAIKNVHAAATYEFSSSTSPSNDLSFNNFLYGAGIDWNVPGLDYFGTTYYFADNEASKNDHQLTFVFGWSAGNWNIDGYSDWSKASGEKAEISFVPQITYNIGPMLGLSNKIKVGVEYQYWYNKFGLDSIDLGTNQNNVSFLLKAHL